MNTPRDVKVPKVAVRAIITNDEGKVLILKRSNTSYGLGLWNLPGGKIDFEQKAIEAVTREIEEETMLKTASASFLFYMDNLPGKGTDLHFVTLFFECRCTGSLSINDESSEYRWIDQKDIETYELAFEHDTALRRYFMENR
jgi:8-oxo-dGTP diphosphatase